jgi:hypothetical protein
MDGVRSELQLFRLIVADFIQRLAVALYQFMRSPSRPALAQRWLVEVVTHVAQGAPFMHHPLPSRQNVIGPTVNGKIS